MRFFIACPANIATGGTELLHQLSWHLSRRGVENYILYWDRKPSISPTPDPFIKYQVKSVESFVDDEQSVLILPEVGVGSFDVCERGLVLIWWLSVDNYFKPYQDLIKEKGKIDIFDLTGRTGVMHFVQSKYAYTFVEKEFENAEISYLGDYINEEIVNIGAEYRNANVRKNICLYNPKKGVQNLLPIMEKCRKDIQWIPLQNFTPEQIALLMCRAKVYIDFGEHPGKDRIPREAAVCGCCIVTNREGSAAFAEDVGIPDEYKISDMSDHNRVLETIYDLVDNYEERVKEYDTYKTAIMNEKNTFEKEVDHMLQIVRRRIHKRSLEWKGRQYDSLFCSIQESILKIRFLYENSQQLYVDREIDKSIGELLKIESVLSALRETNYMMIEDMLDKE